MKVVVCHGVSLFLTCKILMMITDFLDVMVCSLVDRNRDSAVAQWNSEEGDSR
jgi:hypothetical protein